MNEFVTTTVPDPLTATTQNASLLNALQEECVVRLQQDTFFADIVVLSERRKDIESEIMRAISKIGICVIILTPEATVNDHQDCPEPFFDKISVVAQIVEMPITNQGPAGSKKSAAETAERVALDLHFFKPKSGNTMTLDNPSIALSDDEDFLVYNVRLSTSAGLTKQE